ncbi:MAG: polyhydroxybutyrate depolymerase, partial [Kiritimatiellia bacterium]
LDVPPGVSQPAPLVLMFHGDGTRASDQGKTMIKVTRFQQLGRKEGFVTAFPNSFNGGWEDGRAHPFRPPKGVDDVAFVEAMIADISTRTAIDPNRIYAAGMSNGGFFANRLACERTQTFAAYANVVGGMPAEFACTPAGPAPMLLIASTKDPFVPYEGGPVDDKKGSGGQMLAQVHNQTFWRTHNACQGEPTTKQLTDVDPKDRSTVQSDRWTGCSGGSEVWSLTVRDAGHTWPGGPQYAPVLMIGTVNRDIDATQQIWDFFSAHTNASR